MKKSIARFRKVAKERWEYLEKGNSKEGNRCLEELADITMELESLNNLEELEVLLEDLDDGVKFEAASKLLLINSLKAEDNILPCTLVMEDVLDILDSIAEELSNGTFIK